MICSVEEEVSSMRKPRTLLHRYFGFSGLLVALFLSVVYFFCSHRSLLADPDIWWHLRNAQYLFQQHAFIRQDLYSFTVQGKPWINPEWLAEVPYYLAWQWFGYRGLFLVAIGMIEALVGGCVVLCVQKTGEIRAAILACAVFVLLATVSYGPRTLMFGWLCLIVELWVLREFSDGKDRLWILPPLFAVWINLHGSWPIGVLFLVVYGLSRRRDISWGSIYAIGLTSSEGKCLLRMGAGCVAALFCNPYGWRLVAYPFAIFTQHHLTQSVVQEWQSLDFHGFNGRLFFVLLAGLLGMNMARRRRWELHELLFVVISVGVALTYSRFLILAGLVLTPYLAREFTFATRDREKSDKPLLNAALIAVLMGFAAVQIPSDLELKEQADRGYPARAIAYLRTVPPGILMMNDFNWGGYLLWNAREIPVFIDTRADVFEQQGVLADYLDATKLERPTEVLDKYRVGRVVFPTKEPLISLLRQSGDWRVEYEDETAVVLMRKAR
jgi:hypothetical protein